MRRRRSWIIGFLGVLAICLLVVLGTDVLTRWLGSEKALPTGEKVAVVRVEGMVLDARQVVEALERQAKDPKVKAIVLRVDSPGGAVAPTQEIFRAVRALSKKKRVVASLGSMATSGGYYVACAAERIVANPGTLTGSIGVVVHLANFEKLLSKLGIEGQVVKSGDFKDMGSMYRPLSERERNILQEVVNDVHEQFVEDVARSRNMELEKVRTIADGRIFSGRQAKGLGLVDELGGLKEAIQLAAKMAQIKGEPLVLEEPKEKFSLLRWLLDSSFGSLVTNREYLLSGILFLFQP
jgi:protease-4